MSRQLLTALLERYDSVGFPSADEVYKFNKHLYKTDTLYPISSDVQEEREALANALKYVNLPDWIADKEQFQRVAQKYQTIRHDSGSGKRGHPDKDTIFVFGTENPVDAMKRVKMEAPSDNSSDDSDNKDRDPKNKKITEMKKKMEKLKRQLKKFEIRNLKLIEKLETNKGYRRSQNEMNLGKKISDFENMVDSKSQEIQKLRAELKKAIDSKSPDDVAIVGTGNNEGGHSAVDSETSNKLKMDLTFKNIANSFFVGKG